VRTDLRNFKGRARRDSNRRCDTGTVKVRHIPIRN
jgi:hypothetical protein